MKFSVILISLISLISVFFLSACSGMTRVKLEPMANTCTVNHVSPTWLASYGLANCWDKDGQPSGMALTQGKSVTEMVLKTGLTVGAVVGVIGALGDIDAGSDIVIPFSD